MIVVENLSLFALIYLTTPRIRVIFSWESFIIRLDILRHGLACLRTLVENLSLFALIYLFTPLETEEISWESFIIRLDILSEVSLCMVVLLRIFHYSPWYTYQPAQQRSGKVENLSLFALIYLPPRIKRDGWCWESFIIRLDILNTC